MKTITFELSEDSPIMYGSNDDIAGTFLEISEPTGKIASLVAILKSEIGTATKKSLEGVDLSGIEKDDSADEPSPDDLGESSFVMMTMGGANMKRVMVTFEEILRITATLAGEKTFTAPMFNRMSYNDVEGCLKAYIGNFIKT